MIGKAEEACFILWVKGGLCIMKLILKPTKDPEADKKISIVFSKLLKLVSVEKPKKIALDKKYNQVQYNK